MRIFDPARDRDTRIGQPIESLETPALLLNLAVCDRNIAELVRFAEGLPVRLRPHFKNHKCIPLANRQLNAGAVGMTCATLAEAEALVRGGHRDLLIANQIVGLGKVNRLAQLAREARLAVAIDHLDHASAISAAACRADATVDVLVEVNIGMGRCGVSPGQAALDLASQVARLPRVKFRGLQAYEGHVVNVVDRADRFRRAQEAMQLALETRDVIERAGIACPCISGCSSATYQATGGLPGVTEIQAGTYVTMDRQYRRLAPEFEIALTILARVISRPSSRRAIVDVGVKGVGTEFGVPAVVGYPDVEIPSFLSEEHGILDQVPDWRIGDTVQLVPSHACTTCNLHREIIVHDTEQVVDVWPIVGTLH